MLDPEGARGQPPAEDVAQGGNICIAPQESKNHIIPCSLHNSGRSNQIQPLAKPGRLQMLGLWADGGGDLVPGPPRPL